MTLLADIAAIFRETKAPNNSMGKYRLIELLVARRERLTGKPVTAQTKAAFSSIITKLSWREGSGLRIVHGDTRFDQTVCLDGSLGY
jgi:hypothetical protein